MRLIACACALCSGALSSVSRLRAARDRERLDPGGCGVMTHVRVCAQLASRDREAKAFIFGYKIPNQTNYET